jgi:hypothetical protein
MLFMGYRIELTGIEPHTAAVRTALDLNTMVFAVRQVVSIPGAFHDVRLPLRLEEGRMSAVALPFHELGVFSGEVLIFVPARLILRH